ncbi:MAG: hypothetical protein H0T54_05770 [Geodermatophilaceae bacterium]|nr:hypothetical protein [Geodermatophilaceae bacterium]
MSFVDRTDAGRRLAHAVQYLRDRDVIVCGLPRGGVPVAYEVALVLGAPLDVIVVRKLGFPGQPELAMGAVGEAGAQFLDDAMLSRAGLSADQLAGLQAAAADEVARGTQLFRSGRDPVSRAGRTVVIVDDGIATGSTARAACQVARMEGARRVILAVPVAPQSWTAALGPAADEYVALQTPQSFRAVGHWYLDFSATSDAEVINCLDRIAQRSPT